MYAYVSIVYKLQIYECLFETEKCSGIPRLVVFGEKEINSYIIQF